MSSLVSVKGPSMTVVFPPDENLTRAPRELARRPSPASRTPAFISSLLYAPMAASSSGLGITPASDWSFALSSIMKRIGLSFHDLQEAILEALPVGAVEQLRNGAERDRPALLQDQDAIAQVLDV